MKKSYLFFVIFLSAFSILFVSCEKSTTDISVSEPELGNIIYNPLNDVLDNNLSIELKNQEVDKLLEDAYGYVGKSPEEKYQQIHRLVEHHKDQKETGVVASKGHPCLLSQSTISTISNDPGANPIVEISTTGKVCDDSDLTLTAFVFASFVSGPESDFDTQVLTIGQEVSDEVDIKINSSTESTVLFFGMSGLVSEIQGSSSDVIIGKQFSGGYSCPSDKRIALRMKVSATDNVFNDGQVSYQILRSRGCRLQSVGG